VHHHVSHHARNLAGVTQPFVQGERDQAAEMALSHRAERRQRLRGHERRRFLLLHAERSHLRAVAVHHHDAPAGVDKLADRCGHGARVLALLREGALLVGAPEGVASQGDQRMTTHGPTSLAGLEEALRKH
jgi:hypothetical protein